MSDEISSSYDDLFKQSMNSADEYLFCAKKAIDKTFGDGYAKDHPDLVAAYMKEASIYFSMASLQKTLLSIGDKIITAVTEN